MAIKRTGNKKAREICDELESRFLDGERLTIDGIIREYLNAGSYQNYLQSKSVVSSWLNSFKRRFTVMHNLWFGCLNDNNEFGVCNTPAEYNFVLNKYRARVMGSVKRAVQVYKEGAGRKMIANAQDEHLLLPVVPSQDKEEED